MFLSRFSVKRPVTITMAVLSVVIFGLFSFNRIAIDMYPDMNVPVALVMADYSGAGPEEVERMVTEPLEKALETIEGIDTVQSVSREGQTQITAMFDWGTDMDAAIADIREMVDMYLPYLPDDVEDPLIFKMDPALMPVSMYSVAGEDLAALKNILEEDVKSRLERIPGVAEVWIEGGASREIQVIPDPAKLERYGLSIGSLAQVISSENANFAGGKLQDGQKELNVRIVGELDSLSELGYINVPVVQGGTVYLKDIAKIEDGASEENVYSRTNQIPSISLMIQKQSKANTVAISDEVTQEIKSIEADFQDEIHFSQIYNQAEFITKSLNNLKNNAFIGGLLAVLVLYLFLRNIRSTLIISTAIPIAVIGAFFLIYSSGMTLNIMSMGGLALGIGMMIDSSIVILENIYRYREEGHNKLEASVQGADEVAGAVFSSSMTSVAVFLPIVFVQGLAGIMFRDLALTVTFALLASLLVALSLVPMMASKFLRVGDAESSKKGRFKILHWAVTKMGSFIDGLEAKYARILKWSLLHRVKLFLGVLGVIVISLFMVPMVGMEFIPSMDSGELQVTMELEEATVLEETDRLAYLVEEKLLAIPEIETVATTVGSDGGFMGGSATETASFYLVFSAKGERERSIDEIADQVRNDLKEFPGAEFKVAIADNSGFSAGDPVNVEIYGTDLQVLQEISNQVAKIVEEVEGTREVEQSLGEGRPEVQLHINRDAASTYGLTTAQIATAVRGAFYGQTATQYRVSGEEIDVVIKLPEKNRETLMDLKQLTVQSPSGQQIPLGILTEIEIAESAKKIDRKDQVRVATVSSSIFERDLGSISADIQAGLDDLDIPDGYEIKMGGTDADMMESFMSLFQALMLSIALVYMVMAAQFESLIYPFVIMFSLPTMIVGAVLGLLFTGNSLSVPAFIGVIMLAGIVVNNGIVLVDYINTLRARGMDRQEAILKAGPVRLRPILMTTLTTVLAMLPMALGLGEGSETQAPMAASVVGGLITSTFFTLTFVPVVYTFLDDLSIKGKSFFNRKKTVMKEEV